MMTTMTLTVYIQPQPLRDPMPIRRSMIPMKKRMIPRAAPRNPSPMNPSTAPPKNPAMIQKSPPRIQRIARMVIPNGRSAMMVVWTDYVI